MRRRIMSRLALLLLAAACVAFVLVEWVVRPAINPLRRSPDTIAASLLGKTPPGSAREDVERWVDAQGFQIGGTRFTSTGTPPMERVLGSYNSFGFTVEVTAEWVFDENGRLTTIEVSKFVSDAP